MYSSAIELKKQTGISNIELRSTQIHPKISYLSGINGYRE